MQKLKEGMKEVFGSKDYQLVSGGGGKIKAPLISHSLNSKP